MKNYIEMLEEIKQYQPKENSFEEVEKEAILKFLETYQEFAFDRNNLIAHMTSSAIIINKDNEWECPNCGNKDHNKMSVVRRTCGYLGENFWNVGKTKEIKQRVLHL